jgi:hypothetical protein
LNGLERKDTIDRHLVHLIDLEVHYCQHGHPILATPFRPNGSDDYEPRTANSLGSKQTRRGTERNALGLHSPRAPLRIMAEKIHGEKFFRPKE